MHCAARIISPRSNATHELTDMRVIPARGHVCRRKSGHSQQLHKNPENQQHELHACSIQSLHAVNVVSTLPLE
jgi:hypothetical protein